MTSNGTPITPAEAELLIRRLGAPHGPAARVWSVRTERFAGAPEYGAVAVYCLNGKPVLEIVGYAGAAAQAYAL